MKRLVWILLIVVLIASGCGLSQEPGTQEKEVHVGVAFFPMKELLELVREDLKTDGFELKISEFSDYQTPNSLLVSKELDANMIQHDYFLQSFNEANNMNLVTVLPIYHATFALYAKDIDSVEDIPEGAVITLPDDATNQSRALHLLGQAGLLTFQDDKSVGLTLGDIKENPKQLQLDDQVPLTSLAQRYTETGLAVMYPTYAKSLELTGDEQRIFTEELDAVTQKYAISLVSRSDNQDSEAIKSLMRHLKSDKVKQFLIDEYGWASTPAN